VNLTGAAQMVVEVVMVAFKQPSIFKTRISQGMYIYILYLCEGIL
jgi:hypothetical protein